VAEDTHTITAQRIYDLRQQLGLTQQELADKANLERKTIIRIESGQNVPGVRALAALSKVFGVTADYLLGLSNDPHTLPASESDLSELELEAIQAFRRAQSDDQRRRLLKALHNLIPPDSR
jgi:transcriptional regulator with XRE-family HTH domain